MFIDTLTDLPQTQRFNENYGSYPVLRVHDHEGSEIGGRIDGNPVAGRIPVEQILSQFSTASTTFAEQE
ncbi:MAG: hypothetical protein AAF456_23590 [Planctomycetota bacterium]